MTREMTIRPMKRPELDALVDWAAKEGWNPGLHDAEAFWHCDPEGFVAAEIGGEMIGGGSIVSYGGTFGFMGFFIVRPDHRGKGLGNHLWHWRRDRLLARLREPKVIGMDGVFDMQAYYAKGGFQLLCRDLRFEGRGSGEPPPGGVLDLGEIPFSEVEAYDREHFPAPRPAFLRRWVEPEGGHAAGARRNGVLSGFAVLRPCRVGFKIGPLFADDPATADNLFHALSARIPGEPIFLDAPEINPHAVALARNHGMKEVFGCARMYLGSRPELPLDEIFGVTTFELG